MTTAGITGKTALVTGGSRGIGQAICARLARDGAAVAVNYRSNDEAARQTVAQIEQAGGRAIAVAADVADERQVGEMVAQVNEQLGPVDLLVNNAGIFEFVGLAETTPDHWRRTLDTNLTGAYLVTWAVKDQMIERGGGRIVNIASIGGLRARGQAIAYSVSKAGLVMFTKSLSEAIAADNVRVNCVAPGLIDTDMPRVAGDAVMEQLIDATPLKRIGQPEDIAKVVAFLMSDEADFITGQTIVASGGRVLLP